MITPEQEPEARRSVVWFDADAVRDHFDGGYGDPLADLTDKQVDEVGCVAQEIFEDNDEIWRIFGEALHAAVVLVRAGVQGGIGRRSMIAKRSPS